VGAEQTVLLTVGEQDDDVVPWGRAGVDRTSDLEDRADKLRFIDFDAMGAVIKASGGSGKDTLVGSNARDHFYGDGGDDTLRGNGNADDLDGGSGKDHCSGGGGNDNVRNCE
jgi:Ca2+-binding RTX toxin-like protein